MKALKPVLSVRELPPNTSRLRQSLPSIKEYLGERPDNEEDQIIGYLSHGEIACIYPDRGLAYDVLQPGQPIHLSIGASAEPSREERIALSTDPRLAASAILTDGVWLWPAVLIYYVSRYHVRLPENFVAHARSNRWTVDVSQIDFKDLNTDAFESPL